MVFLFVLGLFIGGILAANTDERLFFSGSTLLCCAVVEVLVLRH